jgi:hypothetical protein
MTRTAHYKIICQATYATRYGVRWSGFGKLEAICRALASDGFAYTTAVTFASEDRVHLEVTGTAGPAKKCKPRKPARPFARRLAPPTPKPEQCTKQREKAEATVKSAFSQLPGNLRRNWLEEPGYHSREWMERKAAEKPLHRRIGRAVARILARKHMKPGMEPWRWGSHTWTAKDYAALDTAVGRKVERSSKVSDAVKDRNHGYLGYIVKTYAGSWRYAFKKTEGNESERYTAPNMIAEYQRARADLDFWREMEAASGRREQWKPGLNDDNFYGDEAAA